MTRLNLSQAREEFSDLVNRAAYAKERMIVSHRGQDLAAVIPIEDLQLLERLCPEKRNHLDLEQSCAAQTEPGKSLTDEAGLLRFTAAGLRAARRRRGVQAPAPR